VIFHSYVSLPEGTSNLGKIEHSIEREEGHRSGGPQPVTAWAPVNRWLSGMIKVVDLEGHVHFKSTKGTSGLGGNSALLPAPDVSPWWETRKSVTHYSNTKLDAEKWETCYFLVVNICKDHQTTILGTRSAFFWGGCDNSVVSPPLWVSEAKVPFAPGTEPNLGQKTAVSWRDHKMCRYQ